MVNFVDVNVKTYKAPACRSATTEEYRTGPSRQRCKAKLWGWKLKVLMNCKHTCTPHSHTHTHFHSFSSIITSMQVVYLYVINFVN